MNDSQLVDRIRQVALLTGTFTLRSGRTSSYYLDKYLFETQPDILAAIGQRMAKYADASVTRLAGAELGGVPLVAAAAMACGKPCVFVRNQKKDYGTSKQIEGRLDAGDQVLLVEDVVTSGGQVLEAAKSIEAAGAKVSQIVAVLDRLEGGRENIEKAGYRFDSLYTRSDLRIEAP